MQAAGRLLELCGSPHLSADASPSAPLELVQTQKSRADRSRIGRVRLHELGDKCRFAFLFRNFSFPKDPFPTQQNILWYY